LRTAKIPVGLVERDPQGSAGRVGRTRESFVRVSWQLGERGGVGQIIGAQRGAEGRRGEAQGETLGRRGTGSGGHFDRRVCEVCVVRLYLHVLILSVSLSMLPMLFCSSSAWIVLDRTLLVATVGTHVRDMGAGSSHEPVRQTARRSTSRSDVRCWAP
jgi:hypothetical protein